jgi:hypothetical protein
MGDQLVALGRRKDEGSTWGHRGRLRLLPPQGPEGTLLPTLIVKAHQVKTTTLLTVEQTVEAMRRAGSLTYRAPRA